MWFVGVECICVIQQRIRFKAVGAHSKTISCFMGGVGVFLGGGEAAD
jgi:hypothetical protein